MRRGGIVAIVGIVVGMWWLPATSSAAELRGGIKLGFNLSDIHGSDIRDFPYYDDPDTSWFMRFGFCGGGFIMVNLSRTVALQAEALISMKGSAQTGFSYSVYSLRTTYLEIPLLIRLMSRPRATRGFFLAGPALGIKLRGVLKDNGEPITFDGFKSTDPGLVLGIGAISSRGIVELRYTMGLSRTIEQDGMLLNIKNTAISLTFGYIF